MRRVQAVAVPQEAQITTALPRIDYADAYQVALPDTQTVEIDRLHHDVFTATPDWARRVIRLIGPKSGGSKGASQSGQAPKAGDAQGRFRVFERTDQELISGGNSRHLDFRVSILCPQLQTPHLLTMSTVVQFHNWFGRLYFTLIGPFHRLIVPAMLHRVARQSGRESGRTMEDQPPRCEDTKIER